MWNKKNITVFLFLFIFFYPVFLFSSDNVTIPVFCTVGSPPSSNLPPLSEENVTIFDHDPRIIYTPNIEITVKVDYLAGLDGDFYFEGIRENTRIALVEKTNGIYYGTFKVGAQDIKRDTHLVINFKNIYNKTTCYTSSKKLDFDRIVYKDELIDRLVLSEDDRKTRVLIFTDSLFEDTLFSIRKNYNFAGSIAYDFNMFSAESGKSLKSFKKKNGIYIHFHLSESGIIEGINKKMESSRLMIYYHDGVQWMPIGGELNKEEQDVRTDVGHFSLYAIKAVSGGGLKIGPNPFTPNRDGINDSVVFNLISESGHKVDIYIYKLNGSLVRKLNDGKLISSSVIEFSWNGTDQDNDICEDGLYIYKIIIGEKHYSGIVVLAK